VILALIERGLLLPFADDVEIVEAERFSDLALFVLRCVEEIEPEHLARTEIVKRVGPRLDPFALPLIEQIRAQHQTSAPNPDTVPCSSTTSGNPLVDKPFRDTRRGPAPPSPRAARRHGA